MEKLDLDAPSPHRGTHPRYGTNFPVLYLLVPQILAYTYCGNAPWFEQTNPAIWLFAGLFFLAICAVAVVSEHFTDEKPSARRALAEVARYVFPVAAFFLFCAWWAIRVPPIADGSTFAPRELSAELRIERTFRTTEKNYNGIAIVEKISDPILEKKVCGARVWYSVSKKLFPDSEAERNFAEGARFQGFGVLRGISTDGDKSAEGFADFLRRERVGSVFSVKDSAEFFDENTGVVSRFFSQTKTLIRERLSEISSAENPNSFLPRTGRILSAMFLGERSLLSPEQQQNFLLTGTVHIFAVSGLHITILAAGVISLLNFLRISRNASWIFALLLLLFYVQIVGAPPSAVRAWLMILFIFIGHLTGRGRNSFFGLLAAAFFALLFEPLVLNNVGFRLSYLVVAAILLYGAPAAEYLNRATDFNRWIPVVALPWWRKLLAWLLRGAIDGFCISAAAFLAGTPCVISMFGFCSFLSLPTNVLLVPLVVLASWFGAVAAVISLIPVIGIYLGKILFWLCAIPLAIVDFGTEKMAQIPGIAELSFPHESVGAIGSVLMLLLFFLGETFEPLRKKIWLRFSLPPFALGVFLLLLSY